MNALGTARPEEALAGTPGPHGAHQPEQPAQRAGLRLRPWLMTLLLLLVGGATGACLATRLPVDPTASLPVEPPDPWRKEGLIPVRLSQAEGLLQLSIETSPGKVVHLARSGDRVRQSGLGQTPSEQPYVRLECPPGGLGLRYEGRLYPGSLLVEPRANGGLGVVNWVALEDYVEGVVAAELVLWNAGKAAIQAQAIAARSYAIATVENRRLSSRRPELWDDTRDQAYRGRLQPDSATRARGLDRLLHESVLGCSGRVLEFSGQVLCARYHGSCGGQTAEEAAVFAGLSGPSLSVPCEPCRQASQRSSTNASASPRGARTQPASGASGMGPLRSGFDPAWNFTASRGDLAGLAQRLGLGTRLDSLTPVRQDDSQRWLEVELQGPLGSKRISLNELRRMLGFDRLRSGRIQTTWPRPGERIQDGLYFSGLGSGHGVGLCQRGAIGYGELGLDAERILKHYYPGVRIRQRE